MARPVHHIPSVSRVARRVMSTRALVPVPGRLRPSRLLEALVTACALEAVRWDFAEEQGDFQKKKAARVTLTRRAC